ncbi:MAG: transporter substrate-binding domain-containing protein [Myxococcales bacterium]|nr:transporter substrate-binding domain-containing protein [Myxococcales bacterium]
MLPRRTSPATRAGSRGRALVLASIALSLAIAGGAVARAQGAPLDAGASTTGSGGDAAVGVPTDAAGADAGEPPVGPAPKRVGLAGSEPFVFSADSGERGVAQQLWSEVARRLGWPEVTDRFDNVSAGLEALEAGTIDVLVGPVSITAERAARVQFSQPFYVSHLGIAAKVIEATLWQRIRPLFSKGFFTAVGLLLLVLATVGLLFWLTERRAQPETFSKYPIRGVGTGIWLAVVTMTTVGYGDLAPKTVAGRVVAGSWMVISLISATSLVAGIASVLAITGGSSFTITRAAQLDGHKVATVAGSPAVAFAQGYDARVETFPTLAQAFEQLEDGAVDAVVYDQPQLRYYMKTHTVQHVVVSENGYKPQGYGFATRRGAAFAPTLSAAVLALREDGFTRRTLDAWIGPEPERAP